MTRNTLVLFRLAVVTTTSTVGVFQMAQPDGGFRLLHVAAASSANVTVDATIEYQRLEGFGQAIDFSLVYPDMPGSLSDSVRAIAVEKAYHQVGINMGTIGGLMESPGGYNRRQNDDDDPFTINWKGFDASALDLMKRYVVDLAKPLGFTGYYLGAEGPNVRWQSPWLAAIRDKNYKRFLDEAAEQVIANVLYWKNTYGEELKYYQLGNEQQTGNQASHNPNSDGYGNVDVTQQIVDIVKRAGARLRSGGFSKTRFVVGTEETEEASYHVASAILADRNAAQYVGAIGYHTYPYHRGYSSVPFILSTSGAGKPDATRIGIRKRIRDVAKTHKVNAWVTENSNAGDPFAYDTFRARAIQIHDEFEYANASAYFGESAIWDEVSQQRLFHTTSFSDAEGNVVFVDNTTGKVDIGGIGYAIGHYARWAKPGSVRVNAKCDEPLIEVTALRDDASGQLALILINNAEVLQAVTVSIKGVALRGNWEGEQSTPDAYWSQLASVSSADASRLSIVLPADSVTSVASKLSE